jgi:hypothetical protein
LKASDAHNQKWSNEWVGQKSQKVTTEKMHIGPMKTSEELNANNKSMFSSGGRRHYSENLSNSYKFRPHMHMTDKITPWTDESMKKIIENYPILKPKVERIRCQEDFDELVGGF